MKQSIAVAVAVVVVAAACCVGFASAHSYWLDAANVLDMAGEHDLLPTEYFEMAAATLNGDQSKAFEAARVEYEHEMEEYAKAHMAEVEPDTPVPMRFARVESVDADAAEAAAAEEDEAEEAGEAEVVESDEADESNEEAAESDEAEEEAESDEIAAIETAAAKRSGKKPSESEALDLIKMKTFVIPSKASDAALEKARKKYEWNTKEDGFPSHIKDIPPHEDFNNIQLFGFNGAKFLGSGGKAALKQMFVGNHPKHLNDYHSEGTVGELPNWHSDTIWGLKYLKGNNPRMFQKLSKWSQLPKKHRFDQDKLEATMRSDSQSVTLKGEIDAGRVFFHDYNVLDVRNNPAAMAALNGAQVHLPAPIIIYWYRIINEFHNFVPIAIQILQDFEESEVRGMYYKPIVRTGTNEPEGYAWKFAKICVANADFLVHEFGPHLAHTHLMFEIAYINTKRELPPFHPVHVLVADHARKTLPLNKGARTLLVPIVFRLMGIGFPASKAIVGSIWSRYHFRNEMLPNDLKLRGIDLNSTAAFDRTKGAGYEYAHDASELWNAVKEFTRKVLSPIYPDAASIKADKYLANWAYANGAKITGFPSSIETLDELVDVVTMLTFTPSIQHSAVNYLQQFWQGFLPMAPPSLIGQWPSAMLSFDEKFILSTMPNFIAEAVHRRVLQILSQPTEEPITTHWGKYGCGGMKCDLVDAALPAFRAAVDANTKKIEERVKTLRQLPQTSYTVLKGDRIANSILI